MVAVQPQWTERMYPPGSGQDHLGLGSVSSDQILPKLAPDILVQTVHPRVEAEARGWAAAMAGEFRIESTNGRGERSGSDTIRVMVRGPRIPRAKLAV
jgi:hypothetical protein